MREIRLYGSEGGGAAALPTPITVEFFEDAQTASLLGAGPSLWLGEPQRL